MVLRHRINSLSKEKYKKEVGFSKIIKWNLIKAEGFKCSLWGCAKTLSEYNRVASLNSGSITALSLSVRH